MHIGGYMKLKKILVSIWKDPVMSTLIANTLWFFPTCIVMISFFIKKTRDLLLIKIPLIVAVIIVLVSLIIITYYNRKNKSNIGILAKKEQKITELNTKLSSLESEIKELTTEPDNPRLQLFKKGDVVKMKIDRGINCTEYTVIGKAYNKIIAVNKDNIEQKFSPDALSTAKEYEEETEAFSKDIKNLLQ